jgi:hypothetical protein
MQHHKSRFVAFILLELEQRQIRLYGEPRVSCLISSGMYIFAIQVKSTKQEGLARASLAGVASHASSRWKPRLLI